MRLESAFQSVPLLRAIATDAVRAGGERGRSLRVVDQGGPEASRGTDRAEISEEARRAAEASGDTTPNGEPLSDDEQRQLDELRERDAEVKTHEQAHVAAAGELFRGGPYYDYQTGPDGKRYAVGGSVRIDTSEGDTPEETIRRAQTIRRSALAPQEPSSTDQRVAAKAAQMEAEARAELAEEQAAERDGEEESASVSPRGVAAIEAYSTETNVAARGVDTFA